MSLGSWKVSRHARMQVLGLAGEHTGRLDIPSLEINVQGISVVIAVQSQPTG